MKKVLYFIPAIILIALLTFSAFVDGITIKLGVLICLALFLIAGVVLSINKWWGCLFGIAVGIVIIYSGMQEHGQIINEIPIGIGVCAYYALMGYVCYKSRKKINEEQNRK